MPPGATVKFCEQIALGFLIKILSTKPVHPSLRVLPLNSHFPEDHTRNGKYTRTKDRGSFFFNLRVFIKE